jgi:hypothetical protein
MPIVFSCVSKISHFFPQHQFTKNIWHLSKFFWLFSLIFQAFLAYFRKLPETAIIAYCLVVSQLTAKY